MKDPAVKDYRHIGFFDFIEGKAACESCVNWKALTAWEREEWAKQDKPASILQDMKKPGFCLRHAPRAHQEGTLFKATWPLTEARQQCGEFINRHYEKRCAELREKRMKEHERRMGIKPK